MEQEITLKKAGEEGDTKEYEIVLTIGIYASNDNKEFSAIKNEIENVTSEYKQIKQVHGFYVDENTKNVFFDIIIEFECKKPEIIQNELISKLKNKFNNYNFNIIIDADISE